LQGRSTAALARFYLGEQRYRQAAFREALSQYRAALAEDSTFAYAALRGAQAASWTEDAVAASTMIGSLGRRIDSLPPKYAAFARGLMAYQAGEADSAVAQFHEVLAIDPAAVDAWMALGEVYAHLLPLTGFLDTLAESAFRTVRTLDPTFAPALPHLIEATLRRGDTSATGLLKDFASADPDSLDLHYLDLAVRCALGGAGRMAWTAQASRDPGAVYAAAQVLTAGGLRQADCAEAAWKATGPADSTDALRFGALAMSQGILVARGDTAGARTLVHRDLDANRSALLMLLTIDALAGGPYAVEADSLAASVLRQLAESPDDVGGVQLWLAGVWLAERHRLPEAERVHARAVYLSGARASPMARSLEARLLLARGDTTGAMTILEHNPPRAPKSELSWRPNESLVADRMLLARLCLARKRPWDALEWASVSDAPGVLADVVFLPRSLEIRALAADAAGDQRLARESRRRLAALRGGTSDPVR
jgi:tetratricopeptide (TPR) repeat protein